MKKKLFGRFKNKKKKDASKKRGRKTGRSLRLFLLSLSLVALVWAVWPLRYKWEQQRKISNLKRRTAILKQENKELEKEIAGLNSDDYIEYLARKDLGLVKPGEEAYVVASSEDEKEGSEIPSKPKKKQETVWDRVTNWLGQVVRFR